MRWILAASLLLMVFVCACSATPPASTGYQAATCIPPNREPLPVRPPSTKQRRVAVIGDSFTGGSAEGGYGANNWTHIVVIELQKRGIDIVIGVGAEGGAGYVQGGAQRGHVFADKVLEVVEPDDDVVVLFGSVNDRKASEGRVAYAACDTLRKAILAAPTARLLVIGPPWVNSEVPEGLPRIRDVLRNRTNALGGQFVDPLEPRWFSDRPDLIGRDGVHPTDAGHEYMANKIAPFLEELLRRPLGHR